MDYPTVINGRGDATIGSIRGKQCCFLAFHTAFHDSLELTFSKSEVDGAYSKPSNIFDPSFRVTFRFQAPQGTELTSPVLNCASRLYNSTQNLREVMSKKYPDFVCFKKGEAVYHNCPATHASPAPNSRTLFSGDLVYIESGSGLWTSSKPSPVLGLQGYANMNCSPCGKGSLIGIEQYLNPWMVCDEPAFFIAATLVVRVQVIRRHEGGAPLPLVPAGFGKDMPVCLYRTMAMQLNYACSQASARLENLLVMACPMQDADGDASVVLMAQRARELCKKFKLPVQERLLELGYVERILNVQGMLSLLTFYKNDL